MAREKPQQPGPKGTLFTVTEELREAVEKEVARLGRGGDRKLSEKLSEIYAGHTLHRTAITQILDGRAKASSAGYYLAEMLGCPIPPVHDVPVAEADDEEVGEAWSSVYELRRLDPDLFARKMKEIEEALEHLRALKKIKGK